MPITIRKANPDDANALSRICLLTSDAGNSGEHLHDYPELPGLIFAVPYVTLPTTFGYVLVDDHHDDEGKEEVVGYILGSADTRLFEKVAEETWWPVQRAKYPSTEELEQGNKGKAADKAYIKLLDKMFIAADASIAFSPAHLHINIVDSYQRQGWGRKLIRKSVEHLKGEGIDGVWLGLDMKNMDARRFYEKLGFRGIPSSPDNVMGMKWAQWVDT